MSITPRLRLAGGCWRCLIKILIIVIIIIIALVSQKFYLGLDDTFMGVFLLSASPFPLCYLRPGKVYFGQKSIYELHTNVEGRKQNVIFFHICFQSLGEIHELLLCTCPVIKDLINCISTAFLPAWTFPGNVPISQPLVPQGTLLKLPKSGLGWELLGKESPRLCLCLWRRVFVGMRQKSSRSLPLLIELINFSCTDVSTAATLGNYWLFVHNSKIV